MAPPKVHDIAFDPAVVAASPFTALGLSVPLVRAVLDEGYAKPSPVQAEVVPLVLSGRDVLAMAQTGTGRPRRSCCRFSSDWPRRDRAPAVSVR